MDQQAIRAGCHVLIEKPLWDTKAGVDELAALAESEQKKVMVAQNPFVEALRKNAARIQAAKAAVAAAAEVEA